MHGIGQNIGVVGIGADQGVAGTCDRAWYGTGHARYIGDPEGCGLADQFVEQHVCIEIQHIAALRRKLRFEAGIIGLQRGGTARLHGHGYDGRRAGGFQTGHLRRQRIGRTGQDRRIDAAAGQKREIVIAAALNVDDVTGAKAVSGQEITHLIGNGDGDAIGLRHARAADGIVGAALAIDRVQRQAELAGEHFGRDGIGIGGEAAGTGRKRAGRREKFTVGQAVTEHDNAIDGGAVFAGAGGAGRLGGGGHCNSGQAGGGAGRQQRLLDTLHDFHLSGMPKSFLYQMLRTAYSRYGIAACAQVPSAEMPA